MGLITRWRDRRRIKRVVDFYLSPAMLKKAQAAIPKPCRAMDASYILIQLDDSDALQAAKTALSVRKTTLEHSGIPWVFLSSLGLLIFEENRQWSEIAHTTRCRSCAEELQQALGSSAKLIAWHGPGTMVHVAAGPLLHWGTIVPGVPELIGKLVQMKFGVADISLPS